VIAYSQMPRTKARTKPATREAAMFMAMRAVPTNDHQPIASIDGFERTTLSITLFWINLRFLDKPINWPTTKAAARVDEPLSTHLPFPNGIAAESGTQFRIGSH
jgi:hypothetical protein